MEALMWFASGLLAGGLVTSAVLGLGALVVAQVDYLVRGWSRIALVLMLGTAVLLTIRDLGVLAFRLPENRRQIPREVFSKPLRIGVTQFGFELGTGVRTYITSSAPYLVALTVLLAASVPTALLTGAGFAVGRLATPLVRFAASDVRSWDAAIDAYARTVQVAGTVVTGTTAVLIVATRLT